VCSRDAQRLEGITLSVYWDYSAVSRSIKYGKIQLSQKLGIMQLVPKKSEETHLALNCDYKLATKAIANRLKTQLQKLIKKTMDRLIF